MQKVPFSLSWFIPIFWTTLSLSAAHGFLQWNKTRTTLTEFQHWIERFETDYHRLPYQLAEVRALARAHDQDIAPYDNYGMRLQYLPLTDKDYLIKSFGRDEQENRPHTSVDTTVSTMSQKPETFIQPEGLQQSIPQFYQPAFLEGTQSPQTGLIASVEIQPQFHLRQLLVRSPKNSDFYMVAFHDMVEEFLWLPSGLELVFTAFGSQRYEDGIFYWNLKDNTIHNMLPELRRQFWKDLPEDWLFYGSLSHISHDPALIYLILAPAGSEELNPKEFYSFNNLLAIPINEGLARKVEAQRIQTDLAFTAFDYDLAQDRLLKTAEMASPVQQEWLALSLEGDTEELLSSWQDFSSNHPTSPMCVYGLWWVSSVYNDAFRYLTEQGSAEAQVIRGFGIEMSEALIGMPAAPRYLRAMGRYLKKHLLLSKAADYNVTSLPTSR
jgi:hypothetical protein